MSRTLQEIENSLDGNIAEAIPNASGSQFAEWRIWKNIFARAIWAFEGIMDLFRAEIEGKVQTKQPGTMAWYYDRILEFQGEADDQGNFQGDSLVVVNGVLQYENPDPARRIITQASLRSVSGNLGVKLAKANGELNYQQLSESELLAFGLYLENIKYPGTATTVISLAADLIKYDLEIIYDPVYTTATIDTNVKAKLAEYRKSLGFDDRIYPTKIIDKIMEAEGVVSIKKNSIQGYHATVGVWNEIDIVYTLVSGYFNYDAASSLTFTNFKTL